MVKVKETKKPKARLSDYQVLEKPLITEKSSLIGGDGSCVVFKVAKKASKKDIADAIKRVFNVDVKAVRTCNYIGKVKRTNRSVGRTASYRKAYISLAEGQSIDIVEGL